jgi:hypothetical protein
MTKRDTNLRDRLLAECHGSDAGIAVRALSEAIMIITMNAAPNVDKAVADVDGLAHWMRVSVAEGFDQFLAMRQPRARIGIVYIVSKERIGALASIFRCYRIIRNPIAINTKAKVHIAK